MRKGKPQVNRLLECAARAKYYTHIHTFAHHISISHSIEFDSHSIAIEYTLSDIPFFLRRECSCFPRLIYLPMSDMIYSGEWWNILTELRYVCLFTAIDCKQTPTSHLFTLPLVTYVLPHAYSGSDSGISSFAFAIALALSVSFSNAEALKR